jgi:hypothetical protein
MIFHPLLQLALWHFGRIKSKIENNRNGRKREKDKDLSDSALKIQLYILN